MIIGKTLFPYALYKISYHITKARDIQEIPSKLQPTESAAERLAGMLETLVKTNKIQ